MKKLSLILLITLLSVLSLFADKADYGLYIRSFQYDDLEKTTLTLENGEPIKLGDETTISFSFFVRPESVFGIVSRIITDKKDKVDFTITVGEDDKRYPMLVINNSVHTINTEIECGKWIDVNITLSPQSNSISIQYDDDLLSVPYDGFSKSSSVTTFFGLCTMQYFMQYDIATVNIRDVRVVRNNKAIRHWRLDKHQDNTSLDVIAGVPAIITNPVWLSDIYASWEKIVSKSVEEGSHITYNLNKGIFYIVSPDSKQIIEFDPESRTETIIESQGGCMASNAPNQLFYDSKKDRLISYSIDENITSWFNFDTKRWSNNTKPVLEHRYWNNSTAYHPKDSSLISFGGYGFYKYNNELIRIDLDNNSKKESVLPDISPRYVVSTTIVGNTMYIFGGIGNKSGRQELSPRNTYDFYSVDLLTEQTNKLWEIDSSEIQGDFISGRDLVYDENFDCFYLLSNKDGGVLLRLKANEKGLEYMSLPILDHRVSHYLSMNLYLVPEVKKFYAMIYKTFKSQDESSVDISIYSLNYPPIVAPTQSQSAQEEKLMISKSPVIWQIVAGIFGVVVGASLVYSLVTIKKRRVEKKYFAVDSMTSIQPLDDIGTDAENIKENKNYYDFSKQSISFLGTFCVIDKEGNNVTGQFSPMLKNLLVILILSTIKNGRGIANRELAQLFWFDKDEKSAQNNRNVYLSKLRGILENVGEVEITSTNQFWSIKLSDNIICDYYEIMRLTSPVGTVYENISTQERVNYLLELMLRGGFLPNTEEDWLDSYKSNFSNLIIDALTALVRSERRILSDKMQLKIADTIFLHDPINEEALHLHCSILFNSGKKGLAKSVYDNFSREYLQLLGTKYNRSLEEIINPKE